MKKIERIVFDWASGNTNKAQNLEASLRCSTRDVFQTRIGKMLKEMLASGSVSEDNSYILSAITGEIGNNSFDHNLGNWPDVMGIFFGYTISAKEIKIVLADRGQGILGTLKRVKPDLQNDKEALKVAFTEKISGRAPENRGNGLKFVKDNVQSGKIHLSFFSGNAELELNKKFEIVERDKNIQGCLAILVL